MRHKRASLGPIQIDFIEFRWHERVTLAASYDFFA
jgi:hypothetical protein